MLACGRGHSALLETWDMLNWLRKEPGQSNCCSGPRVSPGGKAQQAEDPVRKERACTGRSRGRVAFVPKSKLRSQLRVGS